MSRRHDPFSPDGNWENTAIPVDLGGDDEALTGDAALRDAPRQPGAEAAQKATKPRRARRGSKNAEAELKEALARLDEASS